MRLSVHGVNADDDVRLQMSNSSIDSHRPQLWWLGGAEGVVHSDLG